MSRNTVKQGGFGITLRQGIQMLQGKDISNYTLVYLDPTSDKRSGDEQTIWNPTITLGRSSSATVKYSDQFPTVSRNHAYIHIEGKKVFLEPDGNATNPTLINRSPIKGKTELFPGDEIQLSYEGPRIRYINTPANKTTASMKFTQRLHQFGSQALRPYKTAISILSILLVASIGYLVWFSNSTSQKMELQSMELALQDNNLHILHDSLNLLESKLSEVSDASSSEADLLNRQIGLLRNRIATSSNSTGTVTSGSSSSSFSSSVETNSGIGAASELKEFESSVYFIIIESVEVYHPDVNDSKGPFDLARELRYRWSGTGFMTPEGEFITARHVIEPWRFGLSCGAYTNNDVEGQVKTFLNNAQLKGGNVEVRYRAISPSGDKFTFTNRNVNFDDSRDRIKCNENDEWHIKQCDVDNLHTDWATVTLKNRPGKLRINRSISRNLQKGTKLFGLGYSHGASMQTFDAYEKFDNIDPIYLEATVVQQNTVNGMINISSDGIAPGSSGGPILVKTQNGWEVIGIVSHGFMDGVKQLVPVWQVR